MTTYHDDPTATATTHGEPLTAREKFDAQVRDAQARASAATDEIGEAVNKSLQEGKNFVRENPGAALAGALGLGVIIGLGLRGRG